MEFHAWEEGAESASMSTNPGGKSREKQRTIVEAVLVDPMKHMER